MSDDLERRVQDSLRAHAADAPSSGPVADRVLSGVEDRRPDPRDRFRWRIVVVSALAAASVVLVAIGAVLVTRTGGDTNRIASSRTQVRTNSPAATAASHGPLSASPSARPSVATSLRHVRVLDLTFTASDDGWALASAQCFDDPSRRCAAIMRSTDGSRWTGHPGDTPFRVPGVAAADDPLVEHIRFATDRIGYAYGPDALFMTTDGGQTWQRQRGGALGLETANDDVVRLVSGRSGTRVQTAALGSSAWIDRSLGAAQGAGASGALMSRTKDDVYVLLTGVRGGLPWTASLFRSSDDGETWKLVSNPCPHSGGYQPTAVAAGTGGQVAVTCRLPQTAQARLATSADDGANFTDHGALPQRDGLLAVGRPGVYLLALDALSRTTDSGASWQTVAGIDPGFVWLGFESDDTGRIVADGGATIWTTRNGGRSWKELQLP